MVWKQIFKTVSFFLYVLAGVLVLPLVIAFTFEFIKDPHLHPQPFETAAFLKTWLIVMGVAFFFHFLSRGAPKAFFKREGIAAVLIIWVVTPALGALPFLFNGTFEHFEDAYFEMTSGFTTTGISIVYPKKYNELTQEEEPYRKLYCSLGTNIEYVFYGTVKPVNGFTGVEAIGKGLLFWRALTQWLGGIGIILLFIAIMPSLEGGAKFLFQSEALGPVKETMTPRIRDTAFILFKIYGCLTAIQLVLLMFTNPRLSFFDAICITFSTISSGGFSVRNNGIASYNSQATEWIVMIFMIVGTINFALFYYLVKGKLFRLKDPELASYLFLLITFSAFAVVKLLPIYSFGDAIRYGVFQIVSSMTTTGFSTGPYDSWPFAVQTLMIVIAYIGGMAASTAGGIKVIRHYILSKLTVQKVENIFRPELVQRQQMGALSIRKETASTILCFFYLYLFVATLAALIYIFSGVDPETSFGLVSAHLNNSGIGFRLAREAGCAFLTPFGKFFSCFLMFLGRLELFIPLVLFIPAFWKRR